MSQCPVDIVCHGHLPGVHLLHLSGRDESSHVDRHISGKDTAESLTHWCQSPGGYSLPGHLPGEHLVHLCGWDEGGHVDRHISGKDTAESLIRRCPSSWWI